MTLSSLAHYLKYSSGPIFVSQLFQRTERAMLGIQIFQSHIDNSTPPSLKGCPLTRAIREHLNNPELSITVGLDRVYINDDNYYYKLENGKLSILMESDQKWTDLSDEAQAFIWEYEGNRKVSPCEL